jgi:ketosteroid isomerase-like protein
MDYAEELRSIMRRLPEIYRSGDIESYLNHYAPDISAFHSGTLRGPDETHKLLKSLFEGDGKIIKFEMGDPRIQFSENSEAAIVSYRWREHFHFKDGRETDTEYYQTDFWLRRNGKWQIANVHESTVKEHPISQLR